MIYPLVRELAADGIPVAVTCRVLKLARQPYYRWLADPVTDAELGRGAPGQRAVRRPPRRPGVRLPVPRRRGPRRRAADGRADRVADLLGQRLVVSVFGKKQARQARRKAGAAGPRRPGRAASSPPPAPNQLWLTDITEHCDRRRQALPLRGQGRLLQPDRRLLDRLDRMKSRLAVAALDNAVARRAAATWPAACCTPTEDRNFEPGNFVQRADPPRHGRLDGPGRLRRRQRRHGVASSACCRRTSSTAAAGTPATSCASRSSPGSNGPTTAAADKPPSAD